MKTQMHANVFKKKCLAAITAMLMAALLVVPANVKAEGNNEPKSNQAGNENTCPADTECEVLSADLKSGADSGSDVITKKKDDVMSFTGVLGVTKIKEQLAAKKKKENDKIKDMLHYEITDWSIISLTDDDGKTTVKTSFTATLTLPDGLEFTENPTAVLSGANGNFEITKQDGKDIKINGKTATVTMTLTNLADVKNFKQLEDKVNGVDSDLEVTLNGVKFSENSEENKPYIIRGQVSGDFSATAKHSIITRKFNFKWTGVQTDAGKYDDGIAIAVKYAAAPSPSPAPVEPEVEIPYVPSDPTEPVVTEVVEPKVGKVAKTGEMANTVNQLGLIILAAASVVIAKKH